MKIGGKIQELRKLSGMTQEQLAEKLDISRQTLSKWESGGTLPDLESVLKLCRIFHVSLDDLLEEEKKAQSTEDKLTIEDLARINRHSRKLTLLLISGLLFIMIAVAIIAVILAVESAALSTQYMLYRYIVLGEYAAVPADYVIPFVLAGVAAAAGLIFVGFWAAESKRGNKKNEK